MTGKRLAACLAMALHSYGGAAFADDWSECGAILGSFMPAGPKTDCGPCPYCVYCGRSEFVGYWCGGRAVPDWFTEL